MDKRTLVFLFGMTVIFFLMNQWLNVGVKTSGTPTIVQPPTQVIISKERERPTLLTPAERKQFQIAKLYKDVDLKELITYGVRQNENFLSLAPNTDLPDVAYLSFEDKGSNINRRVELVVKPENPGDPFLYSLFALSKLETPWVPDDGVADVSLLYFQGENIYKIKGEAIGTDKLIIEGKPPQNALVFLKSKETSSPYGVYVSSTNQLDYIDHLASFENYSVLTDPQDLTLGTQTKDATYYVLQNDYMQLVFSNINGALAEINLPFHSEKNPKSVVREIEIGRTIQNNYPYNNTFPQFSYLVPDGNGGTRKLLPIEGGYYPLIRRDIFGATTTTINPHFYAFNVFELDKIPDSIKYELKRFEKNLIEFELIQDNRRITKIYTLPNNPDEAPYTFDLTVKVDGDARNLFISLGIPEVELISGNFTPTLKYSLLQNNKTKIEEIKPPKKPLDFTNVNGNWYCNGNGFFGIILDSLKKNPPGLGVQPISGELVPSRITIIDAANQRYPTNKYPGYNMYIPISSKAGVSSYRIFSGPFDQKILNLLDQTFANPAIGYNPDYLGAKSYHGWFAFISQPFAKFLFIIMNFFHNITHSWGISIILLTIVLRMMLFPLNNWSMKSNAKREQLAPKVRAIQEKYKKDPKRVQLETMNLYRREGANPFGGCLPMLIQLPFLFGMFDLLKSSFELRGAPFIPGWINNLTAPDTLFSWQYSIPFIGNSFHLLPILLGCIMYFQQKMMFASSRSAPMTDEQKKQRSMGNMMTIVFTVLFYHFPSGLNIYWISSTLLGILQQWMVNKKFLVKGK